MSTLRVLAISGSLRKDSYNTMLLRALPAIAPADMEFDYFDGLDEVPLYNEDLDGDPAPPAVARLREAIETHDGIVLATPEYLRGMPGVVKNALDWASRPVHRPAFAGKAVLVLVATPGRALGFRSLAETSRVLTGMRNVVVPAPEVVVNNADAVLAPDDDGGWRLTDPGAQAFIGVQLEILADLMRANVARTIEESFRRRSAELAARLTRNGR